MYNWLWRWINHWWHLGVTPILEVTVSICIPLIDSFGLHLRLEPANLFCNWSSHLFSVLSVDPSAISGHCCIIFTRVLSFYCRSFPRLISSKGICLVAAFSESIIVFSNPCTRLFCLYVNIDLEIFMCFDRKSSRSDKAIITSHHNLGTQITFHDLGNRHN